MDKLSQWTRIHLAKRSRNKLCGGSKSVRIRPIRGFTGNSRPLVSAQIFIKDQDSSKRLNKSFVNWTSTAGHYLASSVALNIISFFGNYWGSLGIITDEKQIIGGANHCPACNI